MPTRYHYTEELPKDYCATVQLALDKGIISGRSASYLDISEDMCVSSYICTTAICFDIRKRLYHRADESRKSDAVARANEQYLQ